MPAITVVPNCRPMENSIDRGARSTNGIMKGLLLEFAIATFALSYYLELLLRRMACPRR